MHVTFVCFMEMIVLFPSAECARVSLIVPVINVRRYSRVLYSKQPLSSMANVCFVSPVHLIKVVSGVKSNGKDKGYLHNKNTENMRTNCYVTENDQNLS
jgi:hypothetical protein